ncbi:hypothetical protein E2C01_045113 [Portunus trituberculatus]|uniref:Uncharacterized protein n=1 Tax=Portunus trituberculatus TaxID=210409 RepID=A0A5B7G299_PORTR|nr:hypothetical protein [Portunus trituberculatus]
MHPNLANEAASQTQGENNNFGIIYCDQRMTLDVENNHFHNKLQHIHHRAAWQERRAGRGGAVTQLLPDLYKHSPTGTVVICLLITSGFSCSWPEMLWSEWHPLWVGHHRLGLPNTSGREAPTTKVQQWTLSWVYNP